MARHGEWCVIGLWLLAAPAAYPVTLAWGPSAGATGYRLYYGLASQDYDTVLDTGPGHRRRCRRPHGRPDRLLRRHRLP